MDKAKQWVALTVVGVLAVLAAGWFLLVSPKRSDAAQARTMADQQNSTNAGLRAQLDVLKAEQKTQPQEQAKLARVAAKIPDNPALPSLIRALSKAADDTGVELLSMAPGQPTPVGAAAAPTVTPQSAAAGVAKGATGATAPVAGVAHAAGPAVNAGTLESIGLTLSVAGTYFQVEQFFDRLEHLTRAVKVTALTMAPGANPVKVVPTGTTPGADLGTLSTSINATVYMAAGRGVAAAATAPVQPRS